MKSKTLLIGLVVIAISALIVGIGITASSDEQSETGRFVVLGETQSGIFGVTVTTVTPCSDELLGKYEKSDKHFTKFVSDDAIVYWHQRMVDDAIVEKDHIRCKFDKNTKELIEKEFEWRSDIPEHLPPIITREEAESMVGGKIMNTNLWFISPKSHRFPIKPTPKNPCWTVSIADDRGYNIDVIIIDAVEGKILGHGVPLPSSGFSFSGPQDATNCTGSWSEYPQNAESWFNTMGYPTEAMLYPNEVKVKSHIQSTETAVFYEVAHGSSYHFENSCDDTTYATEISVWITGYTKMPFTFIHSCGGMCYTGPLSLSYEFRKGSTEDTVTVGTCLEGNCSETCDLFEWQDEFFYHVYQGKTVKEAFDQAMGEYPNCGIFSCVRFAGDENFAIVPVVERGEYCPLEFAVQQARVPEPAGVLNPLRKLRDDHLKEEYVDRYYEYSPDLTKAMAKDPALAHEAAKLLVKYSPMTGRYVKGISEDKLITREDIEEVVSFTDRLKRSVMENREEIGVERSQEIVKFIDEFKEQVEASEGKTFGEALHRSIYYHKDKSKTPPQREKQPRENK
ncbi:hypothetical protein ES705_11980 [subsurface metagenome]|nr:hypothetical protein [Methanosarcinales archaeon]